METSDTLRLITSLYGSSLAAYIGNYGNTFCNGHSAKEGCSTKAIKAKRKKKNKNKKTHRK